MTRTFHQLAATLAVGLAGALFSAGASADTQWNWSYSGTGINASGTFMTTDVADANGFYEILSITGSRNGDLITGLTSTGTAIPNNEPYAVDNLIKAGANGQITLHGFGYSLASGSFANPYFATYLSTPKYMEVLTNSSAFLSEKAITFTATPVPEPSSVALLMAGLGALGIARRRKHGQA